MQAFSIMTEHIDKHAPFFSAKGLALDVESQLGVKVSQPRIVSSLKSIFKMSYRKVSFQPTSANKVINRILRQGFIQRLLEVYETGSEVLNIDQSSFSLSDSRARGWLPKNDSCNVTGEKLKHRISLIACVSSLGRICFAMTWGTVNSEVMKVFFDALFHELSQRNSDWKQKTVILIDNAPWHRSKATRSYLDEKGIQLMFTAPYSFSHCPVELLFARLKAKPFSESSHTRE